MVEPRVRSPAKYCSKRGSPWRCGMLMGFEKHGFYAAMEDCCNFDAFLLKRFFLSGVAALLFAA